MDEQTPRLTPFRSLTTDAPVRDPAAEGVAVTLAQPEAPSAWPDLNHNGVADWREPWPYRLAWRLFAGFVRLFRPEGSGLRRGVEAVDALLQEAQR